MKQKNFTDGKHHKARELDMIILRNQAPRHTWHDYPWPWVSLTWLLYNLQLWRHRRWFGIFTVRFRQVRKEIASSMYSNDIKHSRGTRQRKYSMPLLSGRSTQVTYLYVEQCSYYMWSSSIFTSVDVRIPLVTYQQNLAVSDLVSRQCACAYFAEKSKQQSHCTGQFR